MPKVIRLAGQRRRDLGRCEGERVCAGTRGGTRSVAPLPRSHCGTACHRQQRHTERCERGGSRRVRELASACGSSPVTRRRVAARTLGRGCPGRCATNLTRPARRAGHLRPRSRWYLVVRLANLEGRRPPDRRAQPRNQPARRTAATRCRPGAACTRRQLQVARRHTTSKPR